jgi:DNA polymerase elongation subunit (family B)
MSYVDALFDRDTDKISVVERIEGERRYVEYPARYVAYYDDPKGKFKSVHGTSVSRIATKSGKEFKRELHMQSGKRLYESDINPIFRCLEENYLNKDAPELQVAFFDIEVDFDPAKGYAKPADAWAPIISITVYLQWLDQLISLAIPPKDFPNPEIIEQKFENTMLCDSEADMLDKFIALIEDADAISGWNSEGFDIPYTVNRISKVMSKDDTRRLCLWNTLPRKRTFERFGNEEVTYDIIGRVHLDYMQLYRKYTYEERHSYALDFISKMELGEQKTPYEGTLDQLYNQDFVKFIEYNRQDVALLGRLDDKLKFIALSNELAHQNTVLIQTTMGAVAVTEQGIINEAHRRGMVVPDRVRREPGSDPAAGAYVAYPKKGLQDWIGSIDINSLYPSVIRALNMAPETIVGQLRQTLTESTIEERMTVEKKSFAGAWEGEFGSLEYQAVMRKDRAQSITIDWETGESSILSAAEVYELIFNNDQPWMLSANGTIFTHEFAGVIPGLLERWYSERKELQAKRKKAIDAGNAVETAFWDKRQLVKKINLNSLYGAILNPGCRFFDTRIGQSTTLTGRCITKHMASKTNEIICGDYDYRGQSIIYGDTDSVYFSAYKPLKNDIDSGDVPWTSESVVQLYDSVAEEVNKSFPKYMDQAFNCPSSYGKLIAAGREAVGSKGLFITKKRYAMKIYDLEGEAVDKIKAMGLDLKRSDTPAYIQDFLSDVLDKVLTGANEEEVMDFIADFRLEFKKMPGWEKGSPRRVNKLTEYHSREKRKGKVNMPGHVRAAINWNTLKKVYNDRYSMDIIDGQKCIVCKLKDNPMGYTSIAYPTDELRIPEWFKELPFADDEMEATLINKKLDNLIGVLDWDLGASEADNTFDKLFA